MRALTRFSRVWNARRYSALDFLNGSSTPQWVLSGWAFVWLVKMGQASLAALPQTVTTMSIGLFLNSSHDLLYRFLVLILCDFRVAMLLTATLPAGLLPALWAMNFSLP